MSADLWEYDVVILGSGPAGLQAALHAARAKAKLAVLGRMKKSSLFRAHVENYCCREGLATGEEMLEQGRRQAEKFGALFMEQDVIHVDRLSEGNFRVNLESGDQVVTWTLILAMGLARHQLNVPGEKELLGRGVSYCVDCDANFFRDQPVVVVGDESAAASGALTLLLYTPDVHLVYRGLSVDERLRYQVERSPIVKHPGCRVKTILGKEQVESVVLENGEIIEARGVFIELGAKGALELVAGLGVQLDSESMKFIATNKKQETSIPGIYAAGDICGLPWQMAKAVGEGCVAGLEAVSYARGRKQQLRQKKLV
jgi:thioredoxin reductase (NADPH)